MRNQSNSTILKTRLWKKSICMFLSIVMALGTFVTMTFSNLTLSDYIDFRNLIVAEAATDSSTPLFYRYGELVGIYTVEYQENSQLQYKIGNDGTWTDYSVPFAIPAHETTKIYARKGTNGKATYASLSNTDKALGVYEESNIDFEILYNNITFPYIRSYNSVDKEWFDSTQSKVVNVDNHIEVELPDGSLYPVIRKSVDLYVDELNGFTLTVTSDNYIFDNGDYKYYFAINGVQDICCLSAVEDYSGNKLEFNRSENNVSISDETGRTFVLSYNDDEIIITDANGNDLEYEKENDKYIQVMDQADVIIGEYTYDDDVMIKSMDKSISYYDNGRLKKITYDNGSFVDYNYDDENMTFSTISSKGKMTKTVYNNAFFPIEYTDEYGNKTEYTYDDHWRVVTKKINDTTVSYTYDDNGNMLSLVTDNDNGEIYYTYDDNNNVVKEQRNGDYYYYTYDDNKNIVISALLDKDYNGSIPNEYDETLPYSEITKYDCDNYGRIIKETTNSDTVYNYDYDSIGNVTKTTYEITENDKTDIDVVIKTYDKMSNLLTESDAENDYSYILDEAGKVLLSNENNKYTRTLYDEYGRIVQEITTEDYNCDFDGLPEINTYSDDNAGTKYVYSENGNLTSVKNRLDVITEYEYYSTGEMKKEKFDIYEFNYTRSGQIDNVKVAGNTTVALSYDDNNNLLEENYANGDSIRYEYDENNNVVKQYHNSDLIPYITYTYNEKNKLTQKVNTDNDLKYVYDEDGNFNIYKLSNNSLIQSYKDTVVEENEGTKSEIRAEETHFGNSHSAIIKNDYISYVSKADKIEYRYHNNDNHYYADSVKFNDENVLHSEYSYDNAQNITEKSFLNNDKVVNAYDTENRILSTTSNNITTNYTYDNNNQLVKADNNSYVYDNRGNIIKKTIDGKVTHFRYNNEWKDQLTSVNDDELTYDEVGNLISFGNLEFSWNSGRLLESITNGNETYTYSYDENGIRTSKTVNGKTTYFNSENGVLLSQTDGINTLVYQYDLAGVPLGFTFNDTQYFYITNQMNDVIGITDSNGTVVANYEYDEWGNEILNDSSEIAEINPLRYRGYYQDTETGYYYLQSRYYNAEICRFINADIPQIAQKDKDDINGLNLFAYCGNNPINCVDYSGYYSAKNATTYAEKWWNGFNPDYKNNTSNGGDCANFVSQCLYAGGLSSMTGSFGSSSGWHHLKKLGVFQISNAWGNATHLMNWLGDFAQTIYYFTSNSDVEKYAKEVSGMSKCTAVIMFDRNKSDGEMNHAAINGVIYNTSSKKDIAFYAHTDSQNGKTSSLKGKWGTYQVIYYIIISFTWG